MLSGDSSSLSSGRLVRLSSAGTPSFGDDRDLEVDFLFGEDPEELDTDLKESGRRAILSAAHCEMRHP